MNETGAATPARDRLRSDLRLVADLIEPQTRVLDVGCGDGALLDYLEHAKGVDARGVEISQDGVRHCVSQGLSVIQGDADADLSDYPSDAFDYVILSQTLQTVREPRTVLQQLTRIGRRAIVSFPNFGYWRVRLYLAVRGRMPVTQALGQPWYETANIHFCTFGDFEALCRALDVTVRRRIAIDHQGRVGSFPALGPLANVFGEIGVFVLEKR